ncbi:hypothetical protein R1flu_025474 [Riccia fluitans]|uniref:Uncharacterized protein n=1 Tax=Riccia fluitans TaxID=41844 RepID=A0ABD1XY17_9MARC
MRWTNIGRMISDGKVIVYSGHDTEYGHGVGIVMSMKPAVALMGWKPVSDRIVTAHFQTSHAKVTIIQAYAPIKDAEGTIKDEFYDWKGAARSETCYWPTWLV